MSCIKCGTWKRPVGPVYGTDSLGCECLKYRCVECGYSWTGSTQDRVKSKHKERENHESQRPDNG